MTLLALIRHMPTGWNTGGRLQGRCDIAFEPDAAPDWRLPPELAGFRFLTSPLRRGRNTTSQLGVVAKADPRLIEMDWGEWEGHTLAELRAAQPDTMAALEARGLDFRPPGGESPRDVQRRLRPLLAEIAAGVAPTAAVTHKGVIRAAYAAAVGWDLLGKPPHRLDWSAAQLFRLDPAGNPRVERLNIPLAA